METGSPVAEEVMGGTKNALASGCEDGGEMSSAKMPVLGNKAVRREQRLLFQPSLKLSAQRCRSAPWETTLRSPSDLSSGKTEYNL